MMISISEEPDRRSLDLVSGWLTSARSSSGLGYIQGPKFMEKAVEVTSEYHPLHMVCGSLK